MEVLSLTKSAKDLLAKANAVDVDAIFAERLEHGSDRTGGLASAFGGLHSCFDSTVRSMGQIVRSLELAETKLAALRYAAEQVLSEERTGGEKEFEALYGAADAIQELIEAGKSHIFILEYKLKDEEIDECRIIPKSEYCTNCGWYLDKDKPPICPDCLQDLVKVK